MPCVLELLGFRRSERLLGSVSGYWRSGAVKEIDLFLLCSEDFRKSGVHLKNIMVLSEIMLPGLYLEVPPCFAFQTNKLSRLRDPCFLCSFFIFRARIVKFLRVSYFKQIRGQVSEFLGFFVFSLFSGLVS